MEDRSLSLGRLPPEQFWKVNDACNRFDTAWRAGQRLRLEDFIAAPDAPEYKALLKELILIEVENRRAAGETPRAADYGQRFVGVDTAWIEAILPDTPTVTSSPPETGHGATVSYAGPTECVGAVIAGRFKLLEEIGEGGMGTVWVAEQLEPVRRKVALKLIKAGMDSKTVLARFEAERQALAMMDHANIAKVLDGGTTEAGRPFFAMEHVKGVPLTKYCDDNRLTIAQRLELFVPVCQAVQHAHQKGIIHRDLKPSNILVCLYDGKPLPKVIDFGLAKAMLQPLTEHTLHTAQGAILGTPTYMSPEQAELGNLDVDTRTDIYSLGVVLYELLTGTTPVEKKRFKEVAWPEMQRLIKEEEPPKPSARLNSNDTLPSVAAQRQLDPQKLIRLVRGELDWIVMKALEKDRTRRYETANGLARDVQRYLADEPVEASPPSTRYRFFKFARKHRAAFLTSATIGLLLVAGVIVTSWLAIWATGAENAARESAKAEKLAHDQAEKRLAVIQKGNQIITSIFEDLDMRKVRDGTEPLEAALAKRMVKAAAQLDGEAVGDPLVVAQIQDRLGQTLLNLSYPQEAITLFEKARAIRTAKLGADHPETLTTTTHLALGYQAAGELDRALPLYEKTLKDRLAKLGADHDDTVTSMNCLALGYKDAGKVDLALPLWEEALKRRLAALGIRHPNTLSVMHNLASGYQSAGKDSLALPLFEQTATIMKATLGADHIDTLASTSNLAGAYERAGKHKLALALWEDLLKRRHATLGADHLDTIRNVNNLAAAYRYAGKTDLAVPLWEDALKRTRAKLGARHPMTLMIMDNLAVGYQETGKSNLAVPLYEETFRLFKDKLGADHPETLVSMNNLARGYEDAGKRNLAVPLLEEALELMKAKLGVDHPHTLKCLHNLAAAYRDSDQLSLALPLYQEELRLNKDKLGADHPDTLSSMNNVAGIYLGAGRVGLALPLLEESVPRMKARLGEDHPDTLGVMNNLAECYRLSGKANLALPLYEHCFKVRQTKKGADDPDTLLSMNNLAFGYQAAGKLQLALPLFVDALKLTRAKLGPDHPRTVTSINNLAFGYYAAGKRDSALPLFEEAALTVEKLHFRHERAATIVGNLVTLREQGNELDQAEIWRRKWAAAVKERSGQQSLSYAGELAALALNLLQQKKWLDAEPVLRDCLAIRGKIEPDSWMTFNTQSMLGGALLGQKKYADAEPLLLKGYEGMETRSKNLPAHARIRLIEAADRLVALYKGMDREKDAAKWAKIAEYQRLDGKLLETIHTIDQTARFTGQLDSNTKALIYQVKLQSGRRYGFSCRTLLALRLRFFALQGFQRRNVRPLGVELSLGSRFFCSPLIRISSRSARLLVACALKRFNFARQRRPIRDVLGRAILGRRRRLQGADLVAHI
jgi:serine/threonine protein kinase/tetratricopeptide (TPR) repeat protein